MLISVATVIVATLVSMSQAGPVTAPSSLKVLRSIPVEKGNLVFYGVDSPLEARAVDLERRETCGDNIISCDDHHEAWVNTCVELRDILGGREGDQISANDHKICHELGGNNRCCVSWANGINFTVRDLFPAFDASMSCNGAANANLISARATWTLLAGECNTQCLSNGDQNCSN